MGTILEEYAKKYAEEVAEELAKERAEELAKERAKEMNTRFAMYMIKDGKSTSEIAEVTHLTEEEINSLRD